MHAFSLLLLSLLLLAAAELSRGPKPQFCATSFPSGFRVRPSEAGQWRSVLHVLSNHYQGKSFSSGIFLLFPCTDSSFS
jgi:hypothetical protein